MFLRLLRGSLAGDTWYWLGLRRRPAGVCERLSPGALRSAHITSAAEFPESRAKHSRRSLFRQLEGH